MYVCVCDGLIVMAMVNERLSLSLSVSLYPPSLSHYLYTHIANVSRERERDALCSCLF
jgi:hypothetical protein